MFVCHTDYGGYKMYGSDEFGQDSPRYTSPKGALYTDSYYIDGNTGTGPGDPWTGSGGGVQPPYSGYAPSHLAQPAYPMHLPHDPMAYSAMSPNGESAAPILGSAVTNAASLPPMSTFRGSAAVAANSGTGAPSPASLQYSHSPGAPTTAPSAPNTAPTTNQQSTTDDTLGKTLASVVSTRIYPTDQSVSSYSSNPSTPVSSPPPLTGSAPGWAPGAAPVSPHFTADPNRGIHMPAPEQQRLDDAIGFLRDHPEECSAGGCKICSKKHSTLLHAERELRDSSEATNKQAASPPVEPTQVTNVVCTHAQSKETLESKHVLLSTALVKVKAKNGQFFTGRALLDNGSQSNFITNDFAKKLNMPTFKENIEIRGINQQAVCSTDSVNLKITSRFGTFGTELTQSALELHKWNANVPSLSQTSPWKTDAVSIGEEAESKLFGVLWNPIKDVFSYKVTVQGSEVRTTKRTVLSQICRFVRSTGLGGSSHYVNKDYNARTVELGHRLG
ncbi:LOW QUALITY PROTEIN: transcription factor 12-like [Monomorium pharaonis]|uniref:LOW QUALITY PROTEIN: transcription factor 12-like n=1 Tax=Monomorium pharaonis TaxID=307658 RepID=UPI001745C59E|nr:LOW QUALITY PROTEIN: transcription factor 12-like [Monomorium pharaonis]